MEYYEAGILRIERETRRFFLNIKHDLRTLWTVVVLIVSLSNLPRNHVLLSRRLPLEQILDPGHLMYEHIFSLILIVHIYILYLSPNCDVQNWCTVQKPVTLKLVVTELGP